jgi:hypothetical protein
MGAGNRPINAEISGLPATYYLMLTRIIWLAYIARHNMKAFILRLTM